MKNGKCETLDELINLTMQFKRFPKFSDLAEDLITIKTWLATLPDDDETKTHVERYVLAVTSDASSRGFEGMAKTIKVIANRPEIQRWGKGQHFS
jgi:hypothetical protein